MYPFRARSGTPHSTPPHLLFGSSKKFNNNVSYTTEFSSKKIPEDVNDGVDVGIGVNIDVGDKMVEGVGGGVVTDVGTVESYDFQASVYAGFNVCKNATTDVGFGTGKNTWIGVSMEKVSGNLKEVDVVDLGCVGDVDGVGRNIDNGISDVSTTDNSKICLVI